MQDLELAIRAAFEAAEATQDPKMSKVKLSLQQAAANAGMTDLAMELRGKLIGGSKNVSAKANRFNTVPPANLAPPPNSFAAPLNVERAASEDDEVTETRQEDAANDAAGTVYAKIANMSPSAIVSVYGESGIESMITKLNGDLAEVDGKKPNQKAAYLKSLCAAQ